jgi:hypothetical protein
MLKKKKKIHPPGLPIQSSLLFLVVVQFMTKERTDGKQKRHIGYIVQILYQYAKFREKSCSNQPYLFGPQKQIFRPKGLFLSDEKIQLVGS